MEFYEGSLGSGLEALKFQFPTGWNSTFNKSEKAQRHDVSISNGMEFYAPANYDYSAKREFQFPTGWNSTFTYSCTSRPQTVSIPNGMEFYDMSAAS